MNAVFALIMASTGMSGRSTSMLEGFLHWAKINEPCEMWLVAFGVIAQTLFFCRWIIQWYASEKRGESHIPMLFWWLSLAGATLLCCYFALRGEPVGVLGQSVGWTVYCRNIYLIRKKRHPPGQPPRQSPELP